MIILIIHVASLSYFFFHLMSKHSPQHSVLIYSQIQYFLRMFIPQSEMPSFTPIQKLGKIAYIYIYIYDLLDTINKWLWIQSMKTILSIEHKGQNTCACAQIWLLFVRRKIKTGDSWLWYWIVCFYGSSPSLRSSGRLRSCARRQPCTTTQSPLIWNYRL